MNRIDKCIYALEKGFTYDPKTGLVKTPRNKVVSKKINGYISLCLYFNKKRYYLYAHQFAWFFTYKEVVELIDHKNNIKTDNRLLNLRSVTKQINALNTKSSGAYLDKRTGRYESLITINGKHLYLGKFDNKEDAERAYKNFKENKIIQLCKYKELFI